MKEDRLLCCERGRSSPFLKGAATHNLAQEVPEGEEISTHVTRGNTGLSAGSAVRGSEHGEVRLLGTMLKRSIRDSSSERELGKAGKRYSRRGRHTGTPSLSR